MIFKKIFDKFIYTLESFKTSHLKVKVDHFEFNTNTKNIIVIYRVGNKKLMNKNEIKKFSSDYFQKCNFYDSHRVTKFETLQNLIDEKLLTDKKSEEQLISYITKAINNEQSV